MDFHVFLIDALDSSTSNLTPSLFRVKGNAQTGTWKWSSYRATAGLASTPEFLTTDWVLGQFGKNRALAQRRYRDFVKGGLESRPWEALQGQIYLGGEAFIEKHAPQNRELKEIPRAQVRAARPGLASILKGIDDRRILQAYKEHGYRLHEIAAHPRSALCDSEPAPHADRGAKRKCVITRPDHPAGNFKPMMVPITRSVGNFCYFFLWLKFSASVFAF